MSNVQCPCCIVRTTIYDFLRNIFDHSLPKCSHRKMIEWPFGICIHACCIIANAQIKVDLLCVTTDYTNPKPIYFRCYNFDTYFLFSALHFNPSTRFFFFRSFHRRSSCSFSFAFLFSSERYFLFYFFLVAVVVVYMFVARGYVF